LNTLPPPITSPAWTGRTKRIVALGVAGIILLAVLRLSEVVPIVGVAIILAYLLSPVVTWIETRVLIYGPFRAREHRGLAVALTYVLIVSLFIVIILVIVPALVQQLEEFGRSVPAFLQQAEQAIEHGLSEPLTFNGDPVLIGGKPFIPLEQLREATGLKHISDVIQWQDLNLVGATQTFISSLTAPAFSVVGGALTAIINVIFLFSMMFFLMRDGVFFIDRLIQVTPPTYRGDARRLFYELGQVWNAYLRGQLTLSLTMGTTVFVVATLLGLPNPIILGMISALLEFIPSIGPGLAIFPAALLAFSSQSTTFPFLGGGTFALVVILAWSIMQNIEAIILVPRVMGGSLNLHPFVVIVAVLAGASLAGVLGIILAAPVVASLRVFGQYIYGKLMDTDPFPTTVDLRPERRRIINARLLLWPVNPAWLVRMGEQVRARLNTGGKDNVG
jgi:predicted PurR-regulated permease PerM